MTAPWGEQFRSLEAAKRANGERAVTAVTRLPRRPVKRPRVSSRSDETDGDEEAASDVEVVTCEQLWSETRVRADEGGADETDETEDVMVLDAVVALPTPGRK